MNILGIDYGKKRIGLAWVQEGLDLVLPFGKVDGGDWQEHLIDLIKRENIGHIVIGLPLGLDGGENANTERVRKFVKELSNFVDIPIYFVDERFSSKQADTIKSQDVSRDELAAMIILESYLKQKK